MGLSLKAIGERPGRFPDDCPDLSGLWMCLDDVFQVELFPLEDRLRLPAGRNWSRAEPARTPPLVPTAGDGHRPDAPYRDPARPSGGCSRWWIPVVRQLLPRRELMSADQVQIQPLDIEESSITTGDSISSLDRSAPTEWTNQCHCVPFRPTEGRLVPSSVSPYPRCMSFSAAQDPLSSSVSPQSWPAVCSASCAAAPWPHPLSHAVAMNNTTERCGRSALPLSPGPGDQLRDRFQDAGLGC